MLGPASDRIHGHIRGSTGQTDDDEPHAEGREPVRDYRHSESSHTERKDRRRSEPKPPPVQRPAGEQHGRQGDGARRPAILSFPLNAARTTVLVTGIDPDTVQFPVTRQRLLGYRDAVEALGLNWKDVVVGATATNDEGEARSLAQRMLTLDHQVDAIAAMSDEQAVGVLKAATSALLRIPETLSISGWDDSKAAAENDLSSVAQDLRAQGASAARLALGDRAEAGAHDWSVVVRTSTRTPPPLLRPGGTR
ncbi:hypothetical protein E3O53_06950 [Cryobacterium sp. TMT2-18-3]|nr:hypothetical protein E3O22_08805 [Cryobacterium sp. TMT2-18-2]TFC65096.1 hypothetical protein E3O53_06950 [Cryobacterium sp. TMT2-18-3]